MSRKDIEILDRVLWKASKQNEKFRGDFYEDSIPGGKNYECKMECMDRWITGVWVLEGLERKEQREVEKSGWNHITSVLRPLQNIFFPLRDKRSLKTLSHGSE